MLNEPALNQEQEAASALAVALQPHLEALLADPLTRVERRLGERSVCLWLQFGGVEFMVLVKASARQQARWRRGRQ